MVWSKALLLCLCFSFVSKLQNWKALLQKFFELWHKREAKLFNFGALTQKRSKDTKEELCFKPHEKTLILWRKKSHSARDPSCFQSIFDHHYCWWDVKIFPSISFVKYNLVVFSWILKMRAEGYGGNQESRAKGGIWHRLLPNEQTQRLDNDARLLPCGR